MALVTVAVSEPQPIAFSGTDGTMIEFVRCSTAGYLADEWVMSEYKLRAPSTTVCGIPGIDLMRESRVKGGYPKC
jgi:hypothetical protein